MDNQKRKSGLYKIALAIILWIIFPVVRKILGFEDNIYSEVAVIGVTHFLAIVVGFVLMLYGFIDLGKSKNLKNQPSVDPVILQKRSRLATFQVFISVLIAIFVFALGVMDTTDNFYNELFLIWGLTVITSLDGLVKVRAGGLAKALYFTLITLIYGGMVVWGTIIAFRNWSW